MGIKRGILIGIILFLTCAGTFILMLNSQIELQRISLGALIPMQSESATTGVNAPR